MSTKTTKKEKEFVIKILEVVQEYENADFNIIESLEIILKMVLIARKAEIPMSKIIKDNKEEWGLE